MLRKLMMLGMMMAMVLVVANPALADIDIFSPDQNAELSQEFANLVSPAFAQGQGSSNASIFSGGSLLSQNWFGNAAAGDLDF